MKSDPSSSVLRDAIQLLLARAPVGKPVSVTLTGIDVERRYAPQSVILRFDPPGVLRCFCATTGKPIFTADSDQIKAACLDGLE